MLVISLVATALAAEVRIEGQSVLVDGAPVVTLSEAPRSATLAGDKLFVLTVDGTVEVWTYAGTPARVSVASAPGAVGLFSQGGRAWAEVKETRAVPVESLAPAAVAVVTAPVAGAPVAVPATAAAKPVGVARVDVGLAVVDGGTKTGLEVGTRVRFLRLESVVVPAIGTEGTETRTLEREVASGVVKQVEPDRAIVEVARGGRVRVGDRIDRRPTSEPSLLAPPRFEGFREIGGVVRPTLALDTLGVGMVDEAWVTVGFDTPWYVSGRLSPIGLGWSTEGNPLSVAALGTGGYDTRYFGVGLGAGWSMLNVNAGTSYYDASGAEIEADFEDVSSAFAFVQEARLGARDGLRLEMRNTLLLTPRYVYTETTDENGQYVGTYTEEGVAFSFGGIAMDLSVPTGDRTDLFFDFGTGDAGATWVEGGVSSWLKGNGDVGSVGLRVGAGYAGLSGRPNDSYVQIGGPMVSVGGRYRF